MEKNINRRRLSRVSKVVEEVDVSIESCLNVELVINPLMEELEVHNQIEEEDIPSKLIGEIFEGTNIVREEVFVSTSELNREGFPITMEPPEGGGIPPPIPPFPPIDPLVRPRGLPIIVPQGLASVDIPPTFSNFMEQRMRTRRGMRRGLLRESLVPSSPTKGIGWCGFPLP